MAAIKTTPTKPNQLPGAAAFAQMRQQEKIARDDTGFWAEGPFSILIIDAEDINRRLLKGILKTSQYRILECRKASEARSVLETERVDLIIVDLMLPEVSGPQFCQWAKSNRETQLIPVLMITSVQGIENEIAAISAGADEFLTKPMHPAVVRARIRALLRTKALTDSLDEAETILFALAQAVEHRDVFTGMHCERLADFSVTLGRALGLSAPDLKALHRGGYLHDIGKVGIPDAILFKKGSLTAEEWDVMRTHTLRGEEICRPMKSLGPVLPIIRNHHEKWDGTGYPDRLAGDQIPLLARILQVTDIYDALTTERCYKPALSRDEAFRVMEEEVRRGWRDPELVEVFRELVCNGSESSQRLSMNDSLANMRVQLSK
ncbi:MAG: response regulator [Acidobacteriota bacterium]|nr:response regulator [Acidobacteriota bacterium]